MGEISDESRSTKFQKFLVNFVRKFSQANFFTV